MGYLVYLFFILLSFGQLTRISLFDQQINIYAHEVIMMIIILFRGGESFKSLYRRLLSAKPTLFFLLTLFVSLLDNFWQYPQIVNLVGLLYWLRLCLYFIFFISLSDWIGKNRSGNLKRLSRAISVFLLLTIVWSTLQYFLYPNLRHLAYLGWDPHYHRVFGLFFDTVTLGIILVLLLFWSEVWRSNLKTIIQILLIVLVLFTHSRVAYLTLILAFYYYKRLSTSWFTILSYISIFLLVIFLVPKPRGEGGKLTRTYSIKARLAAFQEGWRLWSRRPLLGYGYNRLRYVRPVQDINHAGAAFPSSYLTVLAAAGLLGFLSLLILLVSFFKNAPHLGKTLVLIVGLSSLFDNLFLNTFILVVFLSMIVHITPLSDK